METELRSLFLHGRWGDRSGVVEINDLPLSRCYIFVSFRNKVDIDEHYDSNPFWISADKNKDDLECPIHLKVLFPDDMPDVHTFWLSELTIR